MNKKAYIRVTAGALSAILVAGAAWYWLKPKPHIQYLTAPVTIRDMESSVLAMGTLRAADLVSVGAQASGQIKTMDVHLGERVKKGQLIAKIDSMPQINALQTAEAQLQNLIAQRRSDIASLDQARLTRIRQRDLLMHDAGARQDEEAAEASYLVAQANVAALDAQIAAAKISVDTARVSLGYTRIVAPIDGVVVAVLAGAGQTVNANQITPNIVKIANLDTMTVKAQISEADVVRVRSGQTAYFTILGDPDRRYTTTLRAIEPAPDSIASDNSTSTTSSSTSKANAVYYNGLLDVSNSDGRLRISMTAQVNIVLAEASHALVIPSSALMPGSHGGRATVRLLDANGQEEVRAVRIGLDDNTSAQVLTGLKPGDRVIVGVSRPGANRSPWGSGLGGPFE